MLPGYTINGQKLLEFSWSQDMAAADLNVKSAMLWVRLELKPDSPSRLRKLPPNLNFTFWVFRVIASGLRNATYLSGKVCYKSNIFNNFFACLPSSNIILTFKLLKFEKQRFWIHYSWNLLKFNFTFFYELFLPINFLEISHEILENFDEIFEKCIENAGWVHNFLSLLFVKFPNKVKEIEILKIKFVINFKKILRKFH